MPKNQIVRVWWDPAMSSYRIQTPFSQEFVNRIKGPSVPWQERGWDAQTRTWVFTEPFFDLVLSWIKDLWPDVVPIIKTRLETENEARNMLPPGEMSLLAKASITFVDLLDSESLAAAFKSRAQRLHPDKGGDGKKFAELNSAYQELKKDLNGRT
jgi:hypothetical protein